MSATVVTSTATTRGGAPHGMWRVAWRLHRTTVLIWLGVLAALALTYAIFRWIYDAAVVDSSAGPCAADAPCWQWGWQYENVWSVLRLPMLGLPMVMGALVGGALVAQERDRGTQVLALTQSVGRTRWYLTKVAVVVTPLILGLLGLGLVVSWVQSARDFVPWSPLATPYLQMAGSTPATFALLSFGVAIPVGTLFRSVVPAVAVGFGIAVALILTLGYGLSSDLVPHVRAIEPAAVQGDGGQALDVPAKALTLAGGYLNSAGAEVDLPGCPALDALNGQTTQQQYATAWNGCLARAGIVSSYTDYVDASELGRLRATLAALCAAVAALGITLGWARVRRRVV